MTDGTKVGIIQVLDMDKWGKNTIRKKIRNESSKFFVRRILEPTPFYPVHIGTYIRNLYFRRCLRRLPINSFTEVLDAGSGSGERATWMAKSFPWVRLVGIDIKMPLLKGNSLDNLFFRQGDLRKLEDRETYNFVYSIDVLEHIPGNRQVLEKIYRSLKVGGYFYLHMPEGDNRTIFPKRFLKEFHNWVAREHIGEHYALKELEGILKSIGFNIVKVGYTFAFFGQLAWEVDRMTDGKRVIKVLLMPLLKVLAHFDVWLPKYTGNGILVLGVKP